MTDYKEWMQNEGLETAADIVQIYRPLSGSDTSGYVYSVTVNSTGNYIVSGGQETLVLTPRSRTAFIKYMDSLFDLGVEAQDALDLAMSHND